MSPTTLALVRGLCARFDGYLRAHSEPRPFAEMVQGWITTLPPSRQYTARWALQRAYGPEACVWTRIRLAKYRRNEAVLQAGVLQADGRARLDQVVRSPRDRALLGCLYTLRRAEVAALTWAAIDLGPGMAYVMNGKGGKSAWTMLLPDTQLALAAWFEAAQQPPDAAPVFPSRTGGHYRPETIGRIVQGLLRRADLWRRGLGSAHRFRRTFATAYLRANPGDLEGLRRLMRHEQIATTVRYAYLQPEDLAPRLARVRL